MIEDPNFTLKVLKYFAKEDVTFPANITADALHTEEFPDVTLDYLFYHIRCAVELGLLEAQCSDVPTTDGVIPFIGYISGLTAKGGEYVRNSETKFWGDALKKVREVGMAITTSTLLNCMNNLMANAIR